MNKNLIEIEKKMRNIEKVLDIKNIEAVFK